MTHSFDEWMNPQQRECFEAGAQSRQGEVYRLQAEVDNQFVANCKLTDHIHKLWHERDELQKRIDDALGELDSYFGDNYPVLMAIKILKGKEK